MKRLVLIVLMAAPVFAVTQEPKKTKAPNIIVILVDDLGYADLGAFGSADMQTPHLDALAKGGVRFTNFHANSSVCSPTRAALLTGKYPELAGVPGVIRTDSTNSWGKLSAQVSLLPELLKKRNYRTALVGKWHLGLEKPDRPNDRGFDYFHGFLGDMMDDYYHHRRHNINYMRLNDQVIHPSGHATDLFSDWAAEYIRKSRGSKNPFFLYLAYNAPHDPVQPPAEWLEKVRRRDSTLPEKRAKLVAFIEHLDAGIGRVIQALEQAGMMQNTVVFFASDNGGRLDLGANNGAVRSGKGSMYQGGLRVAAFVSAAGIIKKPAVADSIYVTMDIFPTVLDLAGLDYNRTDFDGTSFLPLLLEQKETEGERVLFFCRREGDAEYGGKTIDAVRKGDWKLLQNTPFAPRELYNLREDPLEKNNLADTHREKLRELNRLHRLHLQRAGQVPWQ